MKIQNMLRGIPLLLLMVSGLSVFLSCKGPASNSTPTVYTVTFDVQGGSAVAPLTVEDGKTVEKPADPAKTSFTFGGWYRESAYTTQWNFETDTVTEDITLYAKWTAISSPPPPSPKTVTVTFTEKYEHGTLKAKAGNTELKSGASVKKGTEVTFTAHPADGYEVDYWKINKEEKSGTHKTETVKADKDLTVTVEFKTQGSPSTKIFTIKFNSSKMKCRKNGGGDINPDDTVHENDRLNFDAKLTEGKIVDKWTINGIPKDGATGKTFSYVVMASDEKDGSITIDYMDKQATEAKIRFDSPNMTCTKDGGASISSGDTVHENDQLAFSQTLPVGEIVTKWLVNGSVKKENSPSFHYTVQIADAQSGMITVAYEKKLAAKATIQFEPSKMTCKKNNDKTTVNTGDAVYEQDRLAFEAPEGKTVDTWTVNGEVKKTNSIYFTYPVKADDDGKTLTVDYTEK